MDGNVSLQPHPLLNHWAWEPGLVQTTTSKLTCLAQGRPNASLTHATGQHSAGTTCSRGAINLDSGMNGALGAGGLRRERDGQSWRIMFWVEPCTL